MSRIARVLVLKELRTLAPLSAAAAAAILLVAAGSGAIRPLVGRVEAGVPVLALYAIVAAALGAMTIGHEITHRTLPVLLAQPVARGRLLAIKMAALAVALGLPALAAWSGSIGPDLALPPSRRGGIAFALGDVDLFWPALCGLVLAPWFTVITRNPLAGFVFALAVPAGLWIAAELSWIATEGLLAGGGAPALAHRLSWVRTGVVIAAAIGTIGLWRSFGRLEVLDGTGRGGSARRAAAARARGHGARAAERDGFAGSHHRLVLVALKELRLQQMTLALAACFVAGWVALKATRTLAPGLAIDGLAPIAWIFGTVAAVMAGAVASADERALGTSVWHALLPAPAWQTWLVKLGAVIGLALSVAVLLPNALALLWPTIDDAPMSLDFAAFVVTIAVGALYVSSVTTGGLRALLTAVLVAVPAGLCVAAVMFLGELSRWPMVEALASAEWLTLTLSQRQALVAAGSALTLASWAGALALAAWFASRNHRRLDRSAAGVIRQIGTMAIWLLGTVLMVNGLDGLRRAADIRALRRRR